MPRRDDLETIMVLGSGPIKIGQAAEFDFSGSQAVRALREDGYKVILVNSNPATIQNDPEMADIDRRCFSEWPRMPPRRLPNPPKVEQTRSHAAKMPPETQNCPQKLRTVPKCPQAFLRSPKTL